MCKYFAKLRTIRYSIRGSRPVVSYPAFMPIVRQTDHVHRLDTEFEQDCPKMERLRVVTDRPLSGWSVGPGVVEY